MLSCEGMEEQKPAAQNQQAPAQPAAGQMGGATLLPEQLNPEERAHKVWKLRIVYNRKGCIGSAHCILSDVYDFELDEEMRAVL